MLALLVSAIWFYREVEGWSIVDAIYFSVMTMSTVGYGDFAPSTPYTRSFIWSRLLVLIELPFSEILKRLFDTLL